MRSKMAFIFSEGSLKVRTFIIVAIHDVCESKYLLSWLCNK